MKPEMSAVAHRQSAKPEGRKNGRNELPDHGKKTVRRCRSTTFSRVSKLCRNQMTIVARKMTVNARSRKSFAFSHRSSATLLTDGSL